MLFSFFDLLIDFITLGEYGLVEEEPFWDGVDLPPEGK